MPGSRSLVCKAAAAFVRKRAGLLKFAFFMPAFLLRVTGRLTFEHGHIVRFVNDGFGTVRMCVAGSVDANVFTCFSVGGTGLNGVTVWLFYTAGGIGDPRFFSTSVSCRVALTGPSAPLLCPCSVGSARRGPLCWRPGRVCCCWVFSAFPYS